MCYNPCLRGVFGILAEKRAKNVKDREIMPPPPPRAPSPRKSPVAATPAPVEKQEEDDEGTQNLNIELPHAHRRHAVVNGVLFPSCHWYVHCVAL
jgi:hypothetical protein